MQVPARFAWHARRSQAGQGLFAPGLHEIWTEVAIRTAGPASPRQSTGLQLVIERAQAPAGSTAAARGQERHGLRWPCRDVLVLLVACHGLCWETSGKTHAVPSRHNAMFRMASTTLLARQGRGFHSHDCQARADAVHTVPCRACLAMLPVHHSHRELIAAGPLSSIP